MGNNGGPQLHEENDSLIMMASSSASTQGPPSLKDGLRSGRPLFGVLFETSSPQLVEIAGWLGADFVFFDMEHNDGLDMENMLPMLRAADSAGVPALVRVPTIDPAFIQRVLDWGAAGICAPHVRSVADAEKLVDACRYPPSGRRSSSSTVRAFRYGTQDITWHEYTVRANEQIVVIALVEDVEGVALLDDIAAVNGVDVLWVGPGDLAQSMGVPQSDPTIVAAQKRGLDVAARNGIASICGHKLDFAEPQEKRAELFLEKYRQGYRMFCWADTFIFRDTLKLLLDLPKPFS
jgi:2-keto-3-deoxy-L-rhamnonate aldolase RhmA